jgi:methyl-accepting chemotaxis protein
MVLVREAVDAMHAADEQLEKAVAEVVTITAHNQQAAEAMGQLNNQMVTSLDAVSTVVGANTASTVEMTVSSSEVAETIERIASVSEENSAAVEEVSASTEEMNAQVEEVTASAQSLAEMAQGLQALVARFKLAEAEDPDQNRLIARGRPAPKRLAG